MAQRREPPLSGAAPRSKGSRESMDARRIDLLGSIVEGLGELLGTADQVQPQGRLKERSLHGRPPREANLLGSKVNRLLPLDDDLQGASTHLLNADLSSAGDVDGANWMAEQTVLRE